MRRYSKYKDSCVEWIGDIPEGWTCVTTNKIFQDLGSGTTPISSKEEYYLEGGLNWITTTDLNEGILLDTITKISEKAIIDYPSLRFFPKGSIYISMYGGKIGKIGVSIFDSYCNQSVCVLPNKDNINIKFYYYWFLGFQENVKSMGRGGGQPNISKEMLKQFPTLKIPLKEQEQIVAFLDEKTSHIDKLLDISKRKIGLLKEQRTSIINQVVSKGLNPNAKMKESGVEWIGEIPEGWGRTKIKYTKNEDKNSFTDGNWIESKDLSDEGIRYLTSGNVGIGKFKEQGSGFISQDTFTKLNCIELFEGDLIISRLSLPIGRSCILPNLKNRIVTCVDNVLLRPKNIFNKFFLNYFFNSPRYSEYTELISRGVTLTRISRGMLGNNQVLLPPLKEQEQIVAYLDEKTSTIDKSISIEERRIGLLKEYRQSIISQVVTGKIKVTADE